MNLTIGSGDIAALMAGKDTESHKSLFRKFISDNSPHYNAFASPIDACRAGAILEDRYLLTLPDNYFSQYKVKSSKMDVFISTIDFAKIDKGLLVDFDELKSIFWNDFVEIIVPLKELTQKEAQDFIKKKFKKYYNQVQDQLFCSELDECNLVFLAVNSYEDKENYSRIIQPNEIAKFRIKRDETTISQIKERGSIFQQIKDFYTK